MCKKKKKENGSELELCLHSSSCQMGLSFLLCHRHISDPDPKGLAV